MKKNKKAVKRLPPSRPALFGHGEAKPLIIAGVAIVAVLALSLLLLFSDQFVGKAFLTGTEMQPTAGIADPGQIFGGQYAVIPIKANIQNEQTVAIEFELPLPGGLQCAGVDSFVSNLGWDSTVFAEASCSNDVLYFKYATLDADQAKTGTFDVATLNYDALNDGTYNFQFNSFDIISLNIPNNDLINNGEPAQLVVELEVQMCGNGIQEAAELCDGTDFWNNQDSCQQINGAVYSGGMMGCKNDCTYDFTACEVVNSCGDGNVDQGEGCDDGNLVNGDGCSAACINEAQCGDGVLQEGEACDDDNNLNGDGCSEICAIESLCGNGALNEAEQCDDNNNLNGDGCSSTCQVEEVVPECTTNNDCQQGQQCVNGKCLTPLNLLDQDNDGIDTPEDNCPDTQSQDLTDTDGDGRGDVCDNCINTPNYGQEDADFDGVGDACDPDPQGVVCGNGVKEGNEVCDSGVNNDEPGFCNNQCNGMVPAPQCNSNNDCAQNEFCDNGVCVQQPEIAAAGTKISLTNTDSGNNFATKITATEDFSGTEITIWTILYDVNDKVLSIKSEKVPAGLAMNAEYTATSNYPAANVKQKSVIVYDKEQGSTVFGELTKDY